MPKPKSVPDHCEVCEKPMRANGNPESAPGTVRYTGKVKDGKCACVTCYRHYRRSLRARLVEPNSKPQEPVKPPIPAKLPDSILRRNAGLEAYVLDRRRRGIPSVVGWAA